VYQIDMKFDRDFVGGLVCW